MFFFWQWIPLLRAYRTMKLNIYIYIHTGIYTYKEHIFFFFLVYPNINTIQLCIFFTPNNNNNRSQVRIQKTNNNWKNRKTTQERKKKPPLLVSCKVRRTKNCVEINFFIYVLNKKKYHRKVNKSHTHTHTHTHTKEKNKKISSLSQHPRPLQKRTTRTSFSFFISHSSEA